MDVRTIIVLPRKKLNDLEIILKIAELFKGYPAHIQPGLTDKMVRLFKNNPLVALWCNDEIILDGVLSKIIPKKYENVDLMSFGTFYQYYVHALIDRLVDLYKNRKELEQSINPQEKINATMHFVSLKLYYEFMHVPNPYDEAKVALRNYFGCIDLPSDADICFFVEHSGLEHDPLLSHYLVSEVIGHFFRKERNRDVLSSLVQQHVNSQFLENLWYFLAEKLNSISDALARDLWVSVCRNYPQSDFYLLKLAARLLQQLAIPTGKFNKDVEVCEMLLKIIEPLKGRINSSHYHSFYLILSCFPESPADLLENANSELFAHKFLQILSSHLSMTNTLESVIGTVVKTMVQYKSWETNDFSKVDTAIWVGRLRAVLWECIHLSQSRATYNFNDNAKHLHKLSQFANLKSEDDSLIQRKTKAMIEKKVESIRHHK